MLITVAAVLSGCGDRNIDATGTYAAQGVWDLSGPLSSERTVGNVFSELLIDSAVGSAGLPSSLEAEARSALDDEVGSIIATNVNAQLPAWLQPGSQVLADLALALASAVVESEITLARGTLPQTLTGRERLTWITLTLSSPSQIEKRLSEADLTAIAGTAADAPWDAFQNDRSLAVAEHAFAIYYGALVQRAVEALDPDGELLAAADSSLESACAAVTDATGASISIELGFVQYDFDLVDACADAVAAAGDHALGLFRADAPFEVGGTVNLAAIDDDGRVTRLEAAADYGGSLALGIGPVAPRIDAPFTAERQ